MTIVKKAPFFAKHLPNRIALKFPIAVYLFASAFSGLVGWYSFKRKSVSVSGLAALIGISFSLIWLDQIALLLPLFYMFASSSLLSKLHNKQKQESEKVLGKSGPRDYVQALANLGVATVFILAYRFSGNMLFVVAAVGSAAAGNADSWASEIGALSEQQPFSILNFRPMARGISGGISVMGTMAGFVGSFFLAFVSFITIRIIEPMDDSFYPFIYATSFAGFLAMLFDSLLGALFQALYVDPEKQQLTEHAEGNRLVKGLSWMNNDLVNFLSTLFGGVLSALFYWIAS